MPGVHSPVVSADPEKAASIASIAVIAALASAKAVSGLGYRSRPPEEAIAAAIGWFREHDYL